MGRNFEHSCDQVTFKLPLFKKTPWQWRKSFSSKRLFLPLVLSKNNNNEHAEYHGIFILFKGQIYSKQGSHIFLLFGTWTCFRITSLASSLDEANVSTVNTNLTKFVGDQRLHKNIKWIVFLEGFSYNLFTRTLLLFHISFNILFLSRLPRIRSRQYILIYQGKVSFL